jgi:uncharacterized membrane protein YqaE (UPF0057 family)
MAMDRIRSLLATLLLGTFRQLALGGRFWRDIPLPLLGYALGIVHAVWTARR